MVRSALLRLVQRCLPLLVLGACGGEPVSSEPVPAEPIPPLPAIRPMLDEFGDEARSVVEEALRAAESAPDDAASVARLGMVLQAYDRFEAAIGSYRRALALEPGRTDWLYYLGSLQVETGAHDAAVTSLTETVRLDGAYVPARLKLGEALLETGEVERARTVYATLVAENPANVHARYRLGQALAELGEPEPAVGELTQVVEREPQFGAAHYALGLVFRDLGDTEAAERHIALSERAATREPMVEDPLMAAVNDLRTDARAHLLRGIELDEQGDVQGALDEHLRALAIDSDLLQAHINLISVYARLGRPDLSEQHYRKAMALNPNRAEAHFDFAAVEFGRGRPADAERLLERALELDPAHADAHIQLGRVYEQTGRTNAAINQYREALADRPNAPEAHFWLGRQLLRAGQHEEGLAELEASLTPETPETPAYTYELGMSHRILGNEGAARRWLSQALQQASAAGRQDLAGAIRRDLQALP